MNLSAANIPLPGGLPLAHSLLFPAWILVLDARANAQLRAKVHPHPAGDLTGV